MATVHKVKWAYFGYLGLCLLLVVSIAVSFAVTRTRDPDTNYGAYAGNLKTLDPAEIGDAGAAGLSGYVYECLYNYAYGEDQYRLIPELAEGDPVVSPDGRTMTIRIKPGVHFYDPERVVFPNGTGPEVTADDLIYSWKRVCDFHLGVTSNYAQVFQGHVVGIDEWFAYTQSCKSADDIDWNRPVEGLTAMDRYTLRIRLVDPFPQLKFSLTMIPTAAVSRQVVEHWGDDFKNHPVGTGAYAMSQHLKDQQIVFTANPTYRGGPEVKSDADVPADKRTPFVKRVQLNCFQEPLPSWYLFLGGELDASAIPKDTFGQAISADSGNLSAAMEKDGIGLVKYRNPEVSYIAFNISDPIVGKNKPLRQAMSMAFDRQRYIDLYLNGRGLPANGPIPPGFPTYEADRVAEYCKFNLEAARAKMAEAEKVNGGPIPDLHILYGSTAATATQQADFFVTAMKQIGLTVLTDFKPYGTFLAMIDRKQAQIYNLGWVADYPDEQNYWQLFYSKNAGPGGLNGSNYSNPAFDTLYEQTATMEPGPTRSALYARMQAMVLEDCPWMFIDYPITYQLYHGWQDKPWLSDYGHGFKQYTRIDFAARNEWMKQH